MVEIQEITDSDEQKLEDDKSDAADTISLHPPQTICYLLFLILKW